MITILVYSLKSALVLALLYLPYTLMLRQENFFKMNRATLLAILVLALALPFCDIPSLAIDEQPAVYEVHRQMMLMVQSATTSESKVSDSFSWIVLIGAINIVGVAIVLGIRIWQLFRIGRQIRYGSLWNEKQSDATVYCHIDDVAPFSWMRSIVISEKDYQSDGCREILLHEKAHIFYCHSLDILLLTVVEILQWWNPLVYMLGSSLRDVHEYEADNHVLQQGISMNNYQALLVKKALANTSYAFANNFNHSLVKKRLYMMNHPKSNPWLRSKVLYILPMTLIVLTAFATPKLNEVVKTVVEEIKESVPENVTAETIEPTAGNMKPTTAKTGIPSPLHQDKPVAGDAVTDLPEADSCVNNVHLNEYQNLYQTPEFPGGMEALKVFVQQHVTQTLHDGTLAAGRQAYVQFRIKKDGTIDDIGLVSGDGEAYREAVKMVEQMPRWTPARKRNGEIADGYFVLVVNYSDK